MKKKKVCPYCGKFGHFGYQCYQKNKILYQQRKRSNSKMRSKAPNSPYKASLPSKTYKVSSRSNVAKYGRKKLIKELDKYTSLICRLKSADAQGVASCYTCGRRDIWRNFDCGHYIKRSFQHTRWLQEDVRCQCIFCNRYKNGNYQLYEPKIKAELGEDEVLKLWDKAYSREKISTPELAEMLKEMKKDFAKLVEERKSKGWIC